MIIRVTLLSFLVAASASAAEIAMPPRAPQTGILTQVAWLRTEKQFSSLPRSREATRAEATKMLIEARTHKGAKEFTLTAAVKDKQLEFRNVEAIRQPDGFVDVGTVARLAVGFYETDGAVPGQMEVLLRRVSGQIKMRDVKTNIFAKINANPAFRLKPGEVLVAEATDPTGMAYLLVVELNWRHPDTAGDVTCHAWATGAGILLALAPALGTPALALRFGLRPFAAVGDGLVSALSAASGDTAPQGRPFARITPLRRLQGATSAALPRYAVVWKVTQEDIGPLVAALEKHLSQ